MKPEIRVVNRHHDGKGEYIGRGSPLGNPFTHQRGSTAEWSVATRELAVLAYKGWLQRQIDEGNQTIIQELQRLRNLALEKGQLNLQCFCAPLACHGDVIKEVLEEAINHSLKEDLR